MKVDKKLTNCVLWLQDGPTLLNIFLQFIKFGAKLQLRKYWKTVQIAISPTRTDK